MTFIKKYKMNSKQTNKYTILYKPYDVLSKFSDAAGRKTIKDLGSFPKVVYPVGRLDKDSEGLLLLTNDKRLTEHLLNPHFKHEREYLAFVEGIPSDQKLSALEAGVEIEGQKTLPAKVSISKYLPDIPDRIPPPRTYETHSYCWLNIILTEGRNRQIRHMTAKIGHPTLRLVRWRIANLTLKGLNPGEYRGLTQEELSGLLTLLRINSQE